MVPNFGATYITNLSNIGELMQPSHPYIRNDKRADATRSPLILFSTLRPLIVDTQPVHSGH